MTWVSFVDIHSTHLIIVACSGNNEIEKDWEVVRFSVAVLEASFITHFYFRRVSLAPYITSFFPNRC